MNVPGEVELPYAITSGEDVTVEKERSTLYQPLRTEPALFQTFAHIAPTREGIRAFANRYGLLRTGGALCAMSETGVQAHVERLHEWMVEILFMRTLIGLWTAVQANDERTIRRHIKWMRNGAATFESGRSAASLQLPDVVTLHSKTCTVDLDPHHGSLRVHGWVVHPIRDRRETIEYLKTESVDAGTYFVQVVVNQQLSKYRIGRPSLGYVEYGRLEWQHLPETLLGALWLQFADSIAGKRAYRQCASCGRWFDITQDVARTDKLYCSQTCRTRAYRTRRTEVARLYAMGESVDELAHRFNSDAKTIQRWLRQGD